MTQPNGQQPQPVQTIQPQPVPATFTVGHVLANGGQQLVMFRADTPVGSHIVFLTPVEAKTLAANMERLASQAQTGLILPPGVGL